jgi:hypothetical protein
MKTKEKKVKPISADLPYFLVDSLQTAITDKEMKQIWIKLANWSTVIYHMSLASESDLIKMLVVELETRNRWRILDRLKTRHNSLRKAKEHEILKAYSDARETH